MLEEITPLVRVEAKVVEKLHRGHYSYDNFLI